LFVFHDDSSLDKHLLSGAELGSALLHVPGIKTGVTIDVGRLQGLRGKAVKAFDRIAGIAVNFKEPVDPRHFKNDCDLGRECGKLEIAIALHRFLHAPEEQFHARTIEMADGTKIKDETRAVHLEQGFKFPEKILRLPDAKMFGELFHDHGFAGRHTSPLNTSSNLPAARER
jgi:hypothetical protein